MDTAVGRGRGRGRGGVAGEGGELADLRRPHVPPDLSQPGPHLAREDAARPANLQEARCKKTVSLSAEAPEFVPRTFMQPQAHPQQVHIPNPQQNMQHIQQVITNSMVPPQPQMQYMCHPVVLQVNNLVVQLTLKPNRFEQIARQLTAVFSWQVQDTFLMRELIAVIFEQGVGEVNFRYNGARLCQHLGKNVTQAYNGPTFRSLLLQRCQEEFEVREMYLHNEPERVCGYTLFLAELFTQLVTVNGRPYDILRGALCHLLTTLLSQPTDANLKCVAQVLKCTGNTLDCTNRSEMDQVMCSLKDVAMTAPVASNTRSLLLAVIELRASNWGCGPPSPKESPASTPTHTNIPLGTVYYGPGGIIQRVEDDPEDSASDTDDFINYGWSPAVEELEGDVAEAFEEFLRLQQ
ncbi:polyadenylate-binding protein-interacting protein 1-like isoform X10 [Eriocheir sinensis]|uniref:polyadenylate-binding protein-interacting protein 1-like isoform X10 n=1 Tax=Eriocheir sinensis TaxID=95602 RepID=UPI0021C738EF|nr:polyadenylate-binding protein-interacting protein 1-like isoform X10 [Eriocheir sinensis]